MMKARTVLAFAHVAAVQSIRIVQSNDDGWAELNIRVLNDALKDAGHDVVLSAPAENKSGTGSSDSDPDSREDPCEYDSCSANSGPFGSNSTNSDLNWVNSYPVTSVRYGFDQFGPALWSGAEPELTIAGPNVGSNLFLEVQFSGTVGVAAYSAHQRKVPAIAISGATDERRAWNTDPVTPACALYSELSMILINKIIDSGTPYLPEDVFLNVNIPEATGNCTKVDDFSWVLSRIDPGNFSDDDVNTCGSNRLPKESTVVGTDGCYISISPGDATDKTTVDANRQAKVLAKLADMLACLPEK